MLVCSSIFILDGATVYAFFTACVTAVQLAADLFYAVFAFAVRVTLWFIMVHDSQTVTGLNCRSLSVSVCFLSKGNSVIHYSS